MRKIHISQSHAKQLFSHEVVSNSLQLHRLQHAGLPCPSPSLRVCSYSYLLSQWCHPTLSSCHPLLLLPSIFPSIKIFSNESALRIRCPTCWNFSISPSNEYSGLVSFRIDWFDLLAVQVTLESLLQHQNSKASILQCSTFFMVQLTSIHDSWKSLDYMNLRQQSDVSAF